jgi:3-methyladenine DNA glycosylase AlkD
MPATTTKATLPDVMAELAAMGQEQYARTYRRHGIRGELFGVSYADLGKLKKRLRSDHALAVELWRTGNHDARVLATMLADPAQATPEEIETWVRDVDCYVLTSPVAKIAAHLPEAAERAARWRADASEWVARTGWHVVAALTTASDLPDDYFAALLPEIESGIHTAQNRVREAMNDTLIAIGSRTPTLATQAKATAARIGPVHVDHGETGCKTPAAGQYIDKVWSRRLGET